MRRIKDMIAEGRERHANDYREMTRRLEFGYKFKHYKESESDSPSRILPKDPGAFDIARYKSSLLLKRFPVVVRCRPEDDTFGQLAEMACEDAQHILEDFVTRPKNFYSHTRREIVWGGFGAGVWYARVDLDPESKCARVRTRDPRQIILPDGIRNPHDPDCEWLIDIERIPVERARRALNWKGAKKLRADGGYDGFGGEQTSNVAPGQVDLTADEDGYRGTDKDKCTIARCYYRHSYKRKKAQGPRPLAPGLDYMECPECLWRTPPSAESMMEYPPAEECPQCGGMAMHQEYESEDAGPAYPNGRLVICAPLQEDVGTLYDDAWPCDWPSFPYFFFAAYTDPDSYLPQSEFSIHRTATLAKDALVRLTYEQALRSRPFFAIDRIGWTNARGAPFTFAVEDGDILFSENQGAPPFFERKDPGPINTSIFALYDRLDARERESQGSSQMAFSPDQTRDVAASSLAIQSESGNVPLDEHGAMLYEAESIFLGCVYETERVAHAGGKAVRYSDPTGMDRFKMVFGSYLPKAQVIVSSGPNLDTMEAEKADGYMKLLAVPPPYLRGFAKFNRISPEVVRQIEQDRAQAMQTPGMGPDGMPMQPLPESPGAKKKEVQPNV